MVNNAHVAWLVLGVVIAYAVMLILIVTSGRGYSVQDTQAHSIDFGGVIKEGHGGLTAFLWTGYIGSLIWTIVYFAMHWSEFDVMIATMVAR